MITNSALIAKSTQAKIKLELELILKGWMSEWLGKDNITLTTCFVNNAFNNKVIPADNLLVFEKLAGHIQLHLSNENKNTFAMNLLKIDSLDNLNSHDLLLIDSVVNKSIQKLLTHCVGHLKVNDSIINTGLNLALTCVVMLSNIHLTLYFSSQMLTNLINIKNIKMLKNDLYKSSLSTQKQEFNLRFKTVPITVEELTNLQIGSVVKLEQKINKPVKLHSKLSGHLINSNQHKSLLIRDIND